MKFPLKKPGRIGAANNVVAIGIAVVVLIIVSIVAAYVGGYLIVTLPSSISSIGFVQAITGAVATSGSVFTILFIVLLILAFIVLIYFLMGLGGGGGGAP